MGLTTDQGFLYPSTMSEFDNLKIMQMVYVKSKNETGAVVAIHRPSITVKFLTGDKVEVQEGDFEQRTSGW